MVLGQVEHYWMALADEGNEQLIGYVPMRAVIKADQYDAAVRKQAIRHKTRKKCDLCRCRRQQQSLQRQR